MRFYLDENLSDKIAEIGRAWRLDILSSHECGQNGLTDEQQLKFAATEGRCLVTRDRDDFIVLTVRFFERQWPHAGVLIIPPSFHRSRFTSIAEALARYGEGHPEGLSAYAVDFLSLSSGF